MINIDNIADRAVRDKDGDKFNIRERLVIPMLRTIQNDSIKPCSIALMGEWGCGKTSALNLLRNELKEKADENIVIDFDPTIEGKFEIFELMESFYLKLYAALQKQKKAKKITVSILKSLHILAKNISVYGKASKNIEEVIKLWKKEKPQLMSDKIAELNDFFKNNNKNIYVIIDEVDRLPSKLILNFLMFARVLEVFDKLVCIIAIDYTRVIEKLIKENALGTCDHDSASSYLNKLFQMRFDVCNTVNPFNITSYAVERLENVIFDKDKENYDRLKDQINNNWQSQQDFQNIILHLATPRNVNKWLANVLKNKLFIAKAENKLDWLAFIAVFTKYPIVLDNIIRNNKDNTGKKIFLCVVGNFGGSCDTCENKNKKHMFTSNNIFDCALAGIKISNDHDGCIDKCIGDSLGQTKIYIQDRWAGTAFLNFKKNTPQYLFYLFQDGLIDENQLDYFNKFFNGSIDEVLSFLITGTQEAKLLAADIANSLKKGNFPQKTNLLTLEKLNEFWIGRAEKYFFSSYTIIALDLLTGFPVVEKIIENALLSFSEHYVYHLLQNFGITEENKWDLTIKYEKNEIIYKLKESRYIGIKFNTIKTEEFNQDPDTIKELLRFWITQINNPAASRRGIKKKMLFIFENLRFSSFPSTVPVASHGE